MGSPQRLYSEDAVKEMLGIETFRNLSKDTVIQFISAIPMMDPQVAIKIVEQFPELAKMTISIAKEMKDSFSEVIDANEKSSEDVRKTIDTVIEILETQLNREDSTPEERLKAMEEISRLADMKVDLHDKNQEFLLKGLKVLGTVVSVIFVGTVGILGTNGAIKMPKLGGK